MLKLMIPGGVAPGAGVVAPAAVLLPVALECALAQLLLALLPLVVRARAVRAAGPGRGI